MHNLKVYNDFYYYRGDQNVQQNNMIMMNAIPEFIFSDYLFKLLLIGDSGVGKSCLLLRFAVSLLWSFHTYFYQILCTETWIEFHFHVNAVLAVMLFNETNVVFYRMTHTQRAI